MRIWERDPRQRGLTTIYVPQEPRPIMPTEISDEIVLVHPAQPFPSSLDLALTTIIAGAAGVTVVVGVPPALDRYFWVQGLDVVHTDVTARRANIRLENIATGLMVGLATTPALAIGDFLPLGRALLVPAGHRINVLVAPLAMTAVVSIRMMFVDFLAGEIPPQL